MTNYQEVKFKLTNAQLNKFKSVAKKKTGTILRINAFAGNMSTDKKLSKIQMFEIIQSDESFDVWANQEPKDPPDWII